MDKIIFNILSYSGLILGAIIAVYGLYSLFKRETLLLNKEFQSKKISGQEALKYSLYYIVAGLIWVWFSISQLTGFFN